MGITSRTVSMLRLRVKLGLFFISKLGQMSGAHTDSRAGRDRTTDLSCHLPCNTYLILLFYSQPYQPDVFSTKQKNQSCRKTKQPKSSLAEKTNKRI